GKYDEAKRLYERAVEIWEKTVGSDHPETAMALLSLAALLQAQGRFAETEPLHTRSREILEKSFGPGSLPMATWLTNRAELLDVQ
ncbi:unnamed protein product, partial [Ascophyllum nodosum]